MSENGNGHKPALISKDSAISLGVVIMLVGGSFWLGSVSNRLTVLEAQAAPMAVNSFQIIERLVRLETLIKTLTRQ